MKFRELTSQNFFKIALPFVLVAATFTLITQLRVFPFLPPFSYFVCFVNVQLPPHTHSHSHSLTHTHSHLETLLIITKVILIYAHTHTHRG